MGMPSVLPGSPEVKDGKGAGVNDNRKMISMANAMYFLFLSSSVSVSRGFG